MLVCDKAGKCADIPHHQLDGVERPFYERRNAWIGLVQCIALKAVIRFAAFAKLRIFAVNRGSIEFGNGFPEYGRAYADFCSQFFHGLSAHEVTVAHIFSNGHREWWDASEAVTAQRIVVAQQPGRDFLLPLA